MKDKMKKVEKMTKKYSKMNFQDFWKKDLDGVNKERSEKYDNKSKFGKFWSNRDNPIMKQPHIRAIAERFFEYGKLQMISEVNMEAYA